MSEPTDLVEIRVYEECVYTFKVPRQEYEDHKDDLDGWFCQVDSPSAEAEAFEVKERQITTSEDEKE